MLNINIPDSPYPEQKVTLSGTTFTLTFKYNSRNDSWYLDIKNGSNTTVILAGIKIMPNQNLTGRYIIDELANGNLWCLQTSNTLDTLVNRNNFGSDKTYQLYWLTNQDEEDYSINGTIQL